MKKSFFNLIQDVQKQGKCNRCGGCVTFCSAINYGALSMDQDGKPFFGNIENCIECGLCYSICPATNELEGEIKANSLWKEPFGNTIEISITHAKDKGIHHNGTDGGVVTAILVHLFDKGMINGAIVSKNTPQGRVPWLARTRKEIMESAGSHFGSSEGMVQFAREYSTFSPSLKALNRFSPDRLSFVGTPCQIVTIRKMQALKIIPSDSILFCFGLFCSGNFIFNKRRLKDLEEKYGFIDDDVIKINIKDDFIFSLSDKRQIRIPIAEMSPVKRAACNYCKDFSAEFADISFGGLGAENGWTTSITRTQAGREIFESALKNVLTPYPYKDDHRYITKAEEKIHIAAGQKRHQALQNIADRQKRGIGVIS